MSIEKLMAVAAIAASAAIPMVANASNITIDSVAQRWPWNNKIDITYTVTDGQTLTADPANDVYMKVVFTATIDGTPYTIDGSAIGASATGSAGGTQHTATWTPPADLKVKASGCTMFNASSTLAVGSKQPNNWGLYDTIGNVWEFCLDRTGLANMADTTDPFVPYTASGGSIRVRGSGTWNSNVVRYFYASYRNYAGRTWSANTCGFRVSCIVK